MIKGLNNKGFMFVETIISVVILMTTLISLYTVFSKVITAEKVRLYYDDVSAIYSTEVIKEVIEETLSYSKFYDELNKTTNCSLNNKCRYLYFFGANSPIFTDNDLIMKAQKEYNFYRLAYLKLEDIAKIKNCLKDDANRDTICKNTKDFLKNKLYSHLTDYIITLDVSYDGEESASVNMSSYNGYKGILISLIYETKNGNKQIGENKFQECLNAKVYQKYLGKTNANQTEARKAMRRYNRDNDVNYNMYCENAYYMTWVYL